MARVLVTGSADGLGLGAAKLLASDGHLFHQEPHAVLPAARDPELQDAFLRYGSKLSGGTL